MKKRWTALLLAGALALSLTACGGSEEKSPQQSTSGDWAPTTYADLIVPDKAGTSVDNAARVVSAYVDLYTGKLVSIEDVEGNSGVTAWTALSNGEPDGYTLGLLSLPGFCTAAVGESRLKDLEPIGTLAFNGAVVVVRAEDERFADLQALVDYALANPGKGKAAIDGEKGFAHVGTELFARSAGFTYAAVTVNTAAQQLTALGDGKADFAVVKVTDLPGTEGEEAPFRALGVFAGQRLTDLPTVPTLGELAAYEGWYGVAYCLAAPAGTPKAVLSFYEDAYGKLSADSEYRTAAGKAGVAVQWLSATDTAALLADQFTLVSETIPGLWPEEGQ